MKSPEITHEYKYEDACEEFYELTPQERKKKTATELEEIVLEMKRLDAELATDPLLATLVNMLPEDIKNNTTAMSEIWDETTIEYPDMEPMTRKKHRQMVVDQKVWEYEKAKELDEISNAFEKYNETRNEHKKLVTKIQKEKDWIRKCEKLGWADTKTPNRLVPDHTFDMEHHKKLVEDYTKSLTMATKLKILAIKNVRDEKRYLRQDQIEY